MSVWFHRSAYSYAAFLSAQAQPTCATAPLIRIYRRDKSNFDVREFEEVVINGTDWESVCAGGLESFYDKIIFHLDEMAPFKKVTLKEQRLMLKPWITHHILNKCNKRDTLLNDIRKETDAIKKQT